MAVSAELCRKCRTNLSVGMLEDGRLHYWCPTCGYERIDPARENQKPKKQ